MGLSFGQMKEATKQSFNTVLRETMAVKQLAQNHRGRLMKKILIFTLAFAAYSNAGIFTYSEAESAKRNAREANQSVKELNVKVDNLAKEINELKHVVFAQDSLIKAYFVKDTTAKQK